MPSQCTKKPACIVAIFFSCLLLFSHSLYSQSLLWRSHTFHGEVRDLEVIDGTLWAATGGGVFSYDISANSFRVFNNTSGLSSNNPSSLVRDSQNRLWFGMDDGSLNVIDPADLSIEVIQIDPEPFTVNDLVFKDNTLYLAIEFGISEFLIDKKEIRATFRNLGDFVSNTPVGKLFIDNDLLWAATDRGIAVADLSSPNLQDPQFWINYTTANGLPSNRISGFERQDGVIFAGTGSGVVRITDGTISLDGLSDIPINGLSNLDGILYAVSNNGVYRRISPGNWTELKQTLRNVNALVKDNSNILWAGSGNKGLYAYNEAETNWVNLFPPGPGGNTFEEMILDGSERAWFATGQSANNGVYILDGGNWTHLTVKEGLVSNNTTGAAVDHLGRIWLGTPGQGLMILDYSSGTPAVTLVDTTDGRLSGAVTPAFVIVSKIRRGPDDTMWLVNKFVDNGRAIVAVTAQNEWHYFSTFTDGLSSTAVSNIAFDNSGRLWIATESDGINLLDYGGTVGVKADDQWLEYTIVDGLNSNRITSLAPDREFGMWIGTEEGINYFIEGLPIQSVRGAIGDFITSVAVDPANNKWFGTHDGLSMLAADNITWSHYTKENGDLVDNNIISINIDEDKGDLYIGTGAGLSIISTPFKTPPLTFNKITAYPNPFIIDGPGSMLTIENIVLNSTVLISSINGRVLKKLTQENGGVIGARAYWNGRDENNDIVPSGIYFITAGISGKERGTQKVAVIRN